VRPGGILCAFGFSDAVHRGGSGLGLAAVLLKLRIWSLFGHATARFYSVTGMRKAHPRWYRRDLEALFALLAKRAIRPRVAERIALADVAAAHRRVEAGHLTGKIVLCP
jgi:NADPH:quinone reductase